MEATNPVGICQQQTLPHAKPLKLDVVEHPEPLSGATLRQMCERVHPGTFRGFAGLHHIGRDVLEVILGMLALQMGP